MIGLGDIKTRVSGSAKDGFTRAELQTIRGLFAEARAHPTLSEATKKWVAANHKELLPLFNDPTKKEVDNFKGTKQADSLRHQPTTALTKDAGKQVRSGISAADDTAIQAELGGKYVAPKEFFKTLYTRPDGTIDKAQKQALDALAADPQFKELWSWFETFPGGNPIRLMVVPGMKSDGVERFGGFSGSGLFLIINPTKAEHKSNPMELVDTIVHELVHAALDVNEAAQKKGLTIPDLPFADGIVDLPRDESLKTGEQARSKNDGEGKQNPRYLGTTYGDGASNPKEEYIDINRGAQDYVVDMIKRLLAQKGMPGGPTLTFTNVSQ